MHFFLSVSHLYGFKSDFGLRCYSLVLSTALSTMLYNRCKVRVQYGTNATRRIIGKQRSVLSRDKGFEHSNLG